MRNIIHRTPAPGWVGGFEHSNPGFPYPKRDLSSLPMPDNMDNIDKLTRQQAALWPEFSWETDKDAKDTKRCYQMFAPDISRIGYTDEGKVYSIMCPQQGVTSDVFGALNVEVTVTGNRGWVDEDTREMAADMTVTGKVWFSPSAGNQWFVKMLRNHFESNEMPFPFSKKHAILIPTYRVGDPTQPIFEVNRGQTKNFPVPEFAKHEDEAFMVSNLDVTIGEVTPTGNSTVDAFNNMVISAFNIYTGNLLEAGNVLSWNVWFDAPHHVDQAEWADHAQYWRESIDADHGSPDGPGSEVRYFDGTVYAPVQAALDRELDALYKFLRDHFT